MEEHYDLILKLIGVVGAINTVIFIVLVISTICLWVRGIVPVLWRLGMGLANRHVAIFAKGDNQSSLADVLLDSKLFQNKNIKRIQTHSDIGGAENATVFLVRWADFKDDIDDIMAAKKDQTTMVIYAPFEDGRIPNDVMERINLKRNVAVTNFRGRLLNDIVSGLITTSYEKR